MERNGKERQKKEGSQPGGTSRFRGCQKKQKRRGEGGARVEELTDRERENKPREKRERSGRGRRGGREGGRKGGSSRDERSREGD